MRKLFLTLVAISLNVVADGMYINIDDKSISLNYSSEHSSLEQKLTINKHFTSIDQITNIISKVTNLKTKILSYSVSNLTAIINQSDGTVASFLDKATQKLGYTWKLDKDTIVFVAINPSFRESTLNILKTTVVTNSTWELDPKDRTLRNSLLKWCNKVGWQLAWNVRADYPIATSWVITGSFDNAINEILKASRYTDMPLMAVMYEANKVLEIYSPITNK